MKPNLSQLSAPFPLPILADGVLDICFHNFCSLCRFVFQCFIQPEWQLKGFGGGAAAAAAQDTDSTGPSMSSET